VAPAFSAFPELLRGPGVVRPRVLELHLVATALAPDLNLDIVHGRILQCKVRLG
jgi:hypothetical protein